MPRRFPPRRLEKPNGQTHRFAIDLQNDILEGGALACGRIHLILPQLKKLFARARQMGVPVIYVCDRHYKNDPELQLWNNHMMAGSYGVQIIDEVKPDPADFVVYKNRFNGFVNTTLEKKLRQMQINTVIMTGWRSDVCVSPVRNDPRKPAAAGVSARPYLI